MRTQIKRTVIKLTAVFVFTLLTIITSYLLTKPGGNTPQVSGGTLNIASWGGEDGSIPLSGVWHFYWNRLVSSDDISKGAVAPDLAANVPEVWNSYKIGGKSLPGFGCATYALKVTGAKKGQPLALWVPTFSTAYRLYIDGRFLAGNGTVSAVGAESVAEYRPQQVDFTPSSNEFTIVIQVSNHAYARGGMWYTLYLGSASQIANLAELIGRRDFFLVGSFLLMGFVFFLIFLFRRQERANLYFFFLCLIAILRILIYGVYSINDFLPWNNFSLMVHIDYIVVVTFAGVIALLISQIFPEEISKISVRVFVLYGIAASLLFLVTPIWFFTVLVYPLQIIDIIMVLYLMICLMKAIIHNKPDAPLVLTGVISIMIGFMHDLMFQNNVISGGFFEWSPIGFLLMLVLEAVVLARRFAGSMNENERAVEKIRAMGERERNAELKFLKAQIRPHFLYNCLNTIISISRSDMNGARKLLIEFSNYLRGCFDFKNLEDKVPIESELKLIHSFVILEQARFGEKLKVVYDIDETGLMVPPLILQPLVENAIVHGIRPKPGGGTVVLYVKHAGGLLRLGVRDNGGGITQEKAEAILLGKEQDAGIGIYNINQRLNNIYGTYLHIENAQGGGTDIYMELNTEGCESSDQSHID